MSDYRKIQSGGTAVALENVGELNNQITPTASRTFTVAESRSTVYVGIDALTMTLPTEAAGLVFKFQNTGADGAVLLYIEPENGDIYGTISNAAADSVFVAAANAGNTKATANKGDYIILECDGTNWYIVGGVGIWTES